MSNLDTTQDGPAIQKSIKSIVNNPPGANPSPTYANWLLLYVQAPLRSAFSQGPAKPSVLRVQSVGEGELEELFEDFSDGRVQFALVKVKDTNTKLGKNVFFAWCGEGVPEHVKGSYTSYLSAVSRLFEGYHVQINARTSGDLNPDAVIEKVASASGSNYSNSRPETSSRGPPPAVGNKPIWKPGKAYKPTQSFGSSNPASSRGRTAAAASVGNVDSDGWGEDAPQVTKSSLEKVSSAYKATKVDMNALMSQPSSTTDGRKAAFERPEVVRGAYQPVGKVDIAAIRAQGDKKFDTKPEIVRGAYEPVGKVDLAALRAKAQPEKPTRSFQQQESETAEEQPKSLSDRASAFNATPTSSSSSYGSGRLTSLPKPKPAGSFNKGTFTGTKPNAPGGYDTTAPVIAKTAPIGAANKDFASQGGKTPAQIWQEKKARERGESVSSDNAPAPAPAMAAVYTGRSYGSGGASRFSPQVTGNSNGSEEPAAGGVSALKDRFKGVTISSAARARSPSPPPAPMASKPPPAQRYQEEEEEEEKEEEPASYVPPAPHQRTPSPSPPASPVRIAMPVSRGAPPSAPRSPSPEPVREPSPEPAPSRAAMGMGAGAAAAAVGIGAAAAHSASSGAGGLTGRKATVLYDYEKAEFNEIDLVEGEVIGMIETLDEDWWQGTNGKGETGLFPSNYVEPIMGPEDEDDEEPQHHHEEEKEEADEKPSMMAAAATKPAAAAKRTATAVYDYEAAEENELSFTEGATVTDIDFPDKDWWSGRYNGKEGLFPSNYVELDQ